MTGGICGIDPGISGAVAVYDNGAWALLDMPVMGDAKRREVNTAALLGFLRIHQPSLAIIEYASARPGQGTVSMFRYGAAYGSVKAACTALEIPIRIVTPQKWKAFAGIPSGADKETDRLHALRMFPAQAAQLSRKLDHARADAMWLAYYGFKMNGAGT